MIIKVMICFVFAFFSSIGANEIIESDDSNSQTSKPNAAVLSFTFGEGVSEGEASSISQRFEVELQQTGKFQLIERNEIDKILQEQGFQESGACDEENCNVEIGKLAGLDQMFLGTISKQGDIYSLSIKQINVETGVLIQSKAMDINGGLDLVLSEGCEDLARSMVGFPPLDRSWYRNPWVWTTAGLITTAVVVTYFLTREELKANVRSEEAILGGIQ